MYELTTESKPLDHDVLFYKIGLNPDSPGFKNAYNDNSL